MERLENRMAFDDLNELKNSAETCRNGDSYVKLDDVIDYLSVIDDKLSDIKGELESAQLSDVVDILESTNNDLHSLKDLCYG